MRSLSCTIRMNGEQIDYTELLEHQSRVLKVVIRPTTLQSLGHARILIYNTLKDNWTVLTTLHTPAMRTPVALHTYDFATPTALKRHFKADRDLLVSKAKDVLGVAQTASEEPELEIVEEGVAVMEFLAQPELETVQTKAPKVTLPALRRQFKPLHVVA